MSKINKPDTQWQAELSPQCYDVMRREGTERPFSSPLNTIKERGQFVCAGCGNQLFSSDAKFDSGTGWPSFYEAYPGSIETKTDSTHGMVRTEYHCARCGSHQGHVFPDGPHPTGLRFCNNGIALQFTPEKQ